MAKRRDNKTAGERWLAVLRVSRASLGKLRTPEASPEAEAHRRPVLLAELRESAGDVRELIAEMEGARG